MPKRTSKRTSKRLSLAQVFKMFSTDIKALRWLERIIWGGKPTCYRCGCTDRISPRKGHAYAYQCNRCKCKFTFRTGTVMHASRLGPRKWATAIYLFADSRKSITSAELSRKLDVNPKTGWYMLKRIRQSFQQKDFKLSGTIEVDETYIGGREKNKHARKRHNAGTGTVGKQGVIGMIKRDGDLSDDTLLLKCLAHTDIKTVHPLIKKHIAAGSTLYTDQHSAYGGLDYLDHHVVNHTKKEYCRGDVHTNSIESVWAALKRVLCGVFHHVSPKYLQSYLDEFAFRTNNPYEHTMDFAEVIVANMYGRTLSRPMPKRMSIKLSREYARLNKSLLIDNDEYIC